MSTLIVIEDPRDWPLAIPDVAVVSAREYLTNPHFSDLRRAKVVNLCRRYGYQTVGYYVSLLATARGHKPLPAVATLQDLHLETVVRVRSDDLEDIFEKSLAEVAEPRFRLDIYFGRGKNKRYDRLSQALFSHFPAPLLRADFVKDLREETWRLDRIRPIDASEIPEADHHFIAERAERFFERGSFREPRTFRYEMAILVNPDELDAPSDEKALQRFIRAGRSLGIDSTLIDRDDLGRLAEYDALFIRETTRVNHHTYRFARKAQAEGMPVMDDPESIVRCTNKVYLAELFDAHHIASPKTIIVHRDNAEEVGHQLGFPCVLKQPDSAFSQGVSKASSPAELKEQLATLLAKSELVVAQAYTPSNYDWRIGVLNRRPLYACKYHMARGHWQIRKSFGPNRRQFGKVETLSLHDVPGEALRLASRAAALIGDGLYGVDLKEVDGRFLVIEVNDNPSIESGCEDLVLKEDLYLAVMKAFLSRLEQRGRARDEGLGS